MVPKNFFKHWLTRVYILHLMANTKVTFNLGKGLTPIAYSQGAFKLILME